MIRRFFIMSMLTCLTVAAVAQETVWQIGKFDQSSLEYTARFGAKYVLYQVGKSDGAKIWPGEQRPGSKYEIQFNLNNTPAGTYTLRISALTYAPRIPAFRIDVNGHEGTFYLGPKLSYYLGDQRSIFDAHYSSNDLSILIPSNLLNAGANTIALSVVNTEVPLDEEGAAAELHGAIAAVHYDALSLTHDAQAGDAGQAIDARAAPSIFYHMKDSQLVEEVEAIVRFNQPCPAGSAVLTVGGDQYSEPIEANAGFGEQHIVFEVPEWTGTTKASLELTGSNDKAFDLSLTAARKWTVFVAPHTHVDVGYTDYQGKVAEAQAKAFDEAAGLIKQYPDFRFTTDGAWNLEQFLTHRTPADQKPVLDLIRQGKIGVPAQYLNLLTGYASLETLYRSLYYTKDLSHQLNLSFDYANTTDIPTYSGSYPSILASSGIKYWIVGGNNDRAPILSHEHWDQKSPFWWEGPDGKKVLFWYSRGYSQVMFLFGLPPEQAAIHESLPIFLQGYDRPDYKPNAVLVYGTQPENTDLFPETATFATEWDKNYAYPKLIYATLDDFLHYMGEHYTDALPTYKGDMSGYWEDGIASDALWAAQDRHNQSDALATEVLSSVAQTANPNVIPPKEELDSAWKNIVLFSEHTFTAGVSVRQPDAEESVQQLAVKNNYVTQASFALLDVSNASLAALANQIHVPAQTLVVFNPQNWKHDAVVETDLMPIDGLVDLTTQRPVPLQTLWTKEGFRRVRFLASDLPPVGYKCYSIKSVERTAQAADEKQGVESSKRTVVENQYYRITIDAESGAIRSIFDKQLGRELVDASSPYKFGQYLYVTGGDGETRMINPFKALPLADLKINPSSQGAYEGTERIPWGQVIKLHSSDLNTPSIDTEVVLYDNEKKIEFRYNIQKTYTTAKEAVYFAFPVATQEPKFAYAMQQGWIDPEHDVFKGGSVEWFNVQGWMAALDSKIAVAIVPVDASLASFGDIFRGTWPGEFRPKTSTIFSYAMNNYWHTNFAAGQGGNFTFRYVMTSADHLDAVNFAHLSSESMEGPKVDHVVHQDKVQNPMRPLPPEGASFVNVSVPNVELETWKMAEDGKGTILRLIEVAGQETDATIQLPHTQMSSAMLCSGVEDNQQQLDVSQHEIHLKFHPFEVLTVRVLP